MGLPGQVPWVGSLSVKGLAMKTSEIFYRHDLQIERGFRFHTLSFYFGGMIDLASERELKRHGVEALRGWFDEFGTSKQACFDREELKIRFQQDFSNGEWSECYAARLEQAELSDRHLKMLGKLIKILDCSAGGFELSLQKAIAALHVAGVRQVVYRRGAGAVLLPSDERYVEHEFHGIDLDCIPERFRNLIEAA